MFARIIDRVLSHLLGPKPPHFELPKHIRRQYTRREILAARRPRVLPWWVAWVPAALLLFATTAVMDLALSAAVYTTTGTLTFHTPTPTHAPKTYQCRERPSGDAICWKITPQPYTERSSPAP